MSIKSEQDEISGVVNRLCDNLALTASSQTGRDGVELRRLVGNVRAYYGEYLRDGVFEVNLLACFTAAQTANVKLASLANVHERLFEEAPVGVYTKMIVQIATAFCLAAESRLITAIEFKSREDVEAMMQTYHMAFDTARELAADVNDSSGYQTLTYLAGALTNHLSATSRPLPRMITFKVADTMPALTLSNRVYYTGERWEEIVDENKIIHPAFCPREIRGLSA